MNPRLPRPNDRSPGSLARSQRGTALFVALSAFAVIGYFTTLMISAVQAETQGTELEYNRRQAFKLAEGLLEVGQIAVTEEIANFRPLPNPPPGDPNLVMSADYRRGDAVGAWRVEHATRRNALGNEERVPVFNRTDPGTGLQAVIQTYRVTSEVEQRGVTAFMEQHFELELIPIFQFMVFYTDDLELHPGPSMILDGRVHSNGNMHLGAGRSLTVDTNYLRASGNFFQRRKGGGGRQRGRIEIRNRDTGAMERLPSQRQLRDQGISSLNGLDSEFTGYDLNGDNRFDREGEMKPFQHEIMELLGGTMQTGEHGVQTLRHPDVGTIKPFVPQPGGDYVVDSSGGFRRTNPGTGTHGPGYYHESAGLRILDDRVFDASGNDITSAMPAGFLTRRSVWDARERRDTPSIVINMALLGDMDGDPNTYDPSPHLPANGLVYAAETATQAGQQTAVIVEGGSELGVPDRFDLAQYDPGGSYYGTNPPSEAFRFGAAERQGVTLVSGNPVFVRGDYNTVNKKPASIIADTVNLLSNAWDGSKQRGSSVPRAQETTFNAAIITGNQESGPNSYNGGFENLPRFHENWSGINCNIRGSFVNLWRSEQATGNWGQSGVYSAPNRRWSYDQDFDAGNLPPFTPMIINPRAVLWTSNF